MAVRIGVIRGVGLLGATQLQRGDPQHHRGHKKSAGRVQHRLKPRDIFGPRHKLLRGIQRGIAFVSAATVPAMITVIIVAVMSAVIIASGACMIVMRIVVFFGRVTVIIV